MSHLVHSLMSLGSILNRDITLPQLEELLIVLTNRTFSID